MDSPALVVVTLVLLPGIVVAYFAVKRFLNP